MRIHFAIIIMVTFVIFGRYRFRFVLLSWEKMRKPKMVKSEQRNSFIKINCFHHVRCIHSRFLAVCLKMYQIYYGSYYEAINSIVRDKHVACFHFYLLYTIFNLHLCKYSVKLNMRTPVSGLFQSCYSFHKKKGIRILTHFAI